MCIQLPPNCKFFVDDVESEWTYNPDEAFDYIHGRGMCGSISDWPQLYERMFENLKPGGIVELQDYDAEVTSFNDPDMLRAPHTKEWQQVLNSVSVQFGKTLNVVSLILHLRHQPHYLRRLDY